MTAVRETRRWRGVVAVALVAGAAGLLLRRPGLLLLSVLGVTFAAYPRLTGTPEVSLSLDRRLSDPSPAPGDAVEVTVTVENRGDDALADLRLVDGVPPALPVSSGSPRRGAALRPGGSATFSYAVEARFGRHAFQPATALARDLAGAREVETTVADRTEIDCAAGLDELPVRRRTADAAGGVVADRGGSGLEFHRTREYRRGDPMRRVDWSRLARLGELGTVEYRVERAATVVVLVDARAAAYRGPPGQPHAVARSVSAAGELVRALLADRNRVGVSAFGRSAPWLPPGTGRDHGVRARRLLATHEAFAVRPPETEPGLDAQAGELRPRLPADAQLLVLSPLADDAVADAVRRLDARGHPASVVSPDPTGDDTAGRRLAATERANRASELRRAGVPVVDWGTGEPLAGALAAEWRPGR